MKRLVWVVLLALMLSGCGQASTLETIGNPCIAEPIFEPKEIVVNLPENLASPVIESKENGTLYLCDSYTLTLQTLDGGDMNATLKECTGFSREELTVIETAQGSARRFDCVWTSVGEKADQVGRMAILDDGHYHYALTVMASSEKWADLQDVWYEIFDSFTISTDQ